MTDLVCSASALHNKPLLTAEELVHHLKEKGVTFRLFSEKDAVSYLTEANNYLRLASYRVLFPKQLEGSNVGRYVGLDFWHLVTLSSMDRQLREAFLLATIDVEHFAKMGILRLIEEHGEDGYQIVPDYLASLNHYGRNSIQGMLKRRSRVGETYDMYAGDLIAHYTNDMPIWVFLEVIDFGTFVDLYRFCAERWHNDVMAQEHYVLKSVKTLRNAAAHDHCIVNGMTRSAERTDYPTNALITDSLNAAGMDRSKSRRAKLSNLRIAQMASTLYSLNIYCTRSHTIGRHSNRFSLIRRESETILSTISVNNSVVAFFEFLWKLVDIWL